MINSVVLLAMGIAAALSPAVNQEIPKNVTEDSVYRAVVDRIEDVEGGDYAVVEVSGDGDEYLVDVPMYQFNEPVQKDTHLDVDSYVTVMDSVSLSLDGEVLYQFTPKDASNVFKWNVTSGFLGYVPKLWEEYAVVYSPNGTEDETDDIILFAFPMEVGEK